MTTALDSTMPTRKPTGTRGRRRSRRLCRRRSPASARLRGPPAPGDRRPHARPPLERHASRNRDEPTTRRSTKMTCRAQSRSGVLAWASATSSTARSPRPGAGSPERERAPRADREPIRRTRAACSIPRRSRQPEEGAIAQASLRPFEAMAAAIARRSERSRPGARSPGSASATDLIGRAGDGRDRRASTKPCSPVASGEVSPERRRPRLLRVRSSPTRPVFDLGRAQEWTAALARVVRGRAGRDSVPRPLPGVPIRAPRSSARAVGRRCRRRSQRARDCACSARRSAPAIGEADYQQAELDRLRGSSLGGRGRRLPSGPPSMAAGGPSPASPSSASRRVGRPTRLATIRRAMDETVDPI